MTRRNPLLGGSAGFVLVLVQAAAAGCANAPEPDRPEVANGPSELRLDYGPVLRAVGPRSARFLFHASRADGSELPWTAGVEIAPAGEFGPRGLLPVPEVEVSAATDFVAHVTVEGLAPQTRYVYVPRINGRRAFEDDPSEFPSFLTPPDLGQRNADFTVVFLADQHVPDGAEAVSLAAYTVAARELPLFWAQLGDVATGSTTPGRSEEDRSREELRAVWLRNHAVDSPQARFMQSHSLNLATISDHEVMDNFSMNWHHSPKGHDANATLHDRVARYDRSVRTWWNYFGWGASLTDRLGRLAARDRGGSVMAEAPVGVLEDVTDRRVCLENEAAQGFEEGDLVYLVEEDGEALHSSLAGLGAPGSCANGRGAVVTLADEPVRSYQAARLGWGALYATHGHYHAHRPYPFVEFFLLDTTSYRGDPYQQREFYERRANRDTDHSRYPWNPDDGRMYIFGDREHGANRTTDGVRSWLGPTQRRAFLEAIADSDAKVLVVAAGYPLYSAKFEWSGRYWEAREGGFDFATEAEEIVSALERSDKLVLWVHGDGHTPMHVRLGRNLHQLQIGPTFMGHAETPGHRSRTLASGDVSGSDSIGGGKLVAGHQPDLAFGDENEDVFAGHLDQFEGYLRLYFHPGREALRSSERFGLRRGDSDHLVEIPADSDPARGAAAERIVGRVVRLHFGERRRHSVVRSYRYTNRRVALELETPIVTENPDLLRLLLDDTPWVEARWFDARGREWREFGGVLRHEPE